MAVNIFGEINSLDTSQFLTVPRANNMYVNESGDDMEGPLDLKNNKIVNVANPVNPQDVSTKYYVDCAEAACVKAVSNEMDLKLLTKPDKDYVDSHKWTAESITSGTIDIARLPPIQATLDPTYTRYLDYNYILFTYNPKFWLSGFYNKGIGKSTSIELTGNGISFSTHLDVSTPGIRYFRFLKVSYIVSKYEFQKTYTFITITKRLTPGRVFTSLTGNKLFGYWNKYKNVVFHDELLTPIAQRVEAPDDDSLQLFIYNCSETMKSLYFTDNHWLTNNLTSTTKWGNLVIGDTVMKEGARFELYECIGFDKSLSVSEMNEIKSILRKFYQI